ncbi:CHAT domain-containing protein [Leptothoe sp. PORK10 BA2]|uniref:CHAT domain-containing protein n=1 Tax=Leptothoe sp. PORK10 BA2 TaxID=3110254 RepID=UPI002B202D1C|nr:tetratricopeptide repeat protein [Leptothoe sp. PORK10 BA2]MEA5466940.1 tetratricopeptide repeat protein [Leptothoe sp. PORK10 BA2]
MTLPLAFADAGRAVVLESLKPLPSTSFSKPDKLVQLPAAGSASSRQKQTSRVNLPVAGEYRILANAHDAQGRGTCLTVGEASVTELSQAERVSELEGLLQEGRSLYNQSQFQEALSVFEDALQASRQIGNQAIEARILNALSDTSWWLGNFSDALGYAEASFTLSELIGDRSGVADALRDIGDVYKSLSQYPEALEQYEQSLVITREIGDRAGEADTLNNIGNVYQSLGEYSEALEQYEQSLVITRVIGDRATEARTFNNIGIVHQSLGEYPEALEQYEQSLVITREIGDRATEARTFNNIGLVHQSLGEYLGALEQYEQSLVITREIGDRATEAQTLNNIGNVHQSLGKYSEALEQYEQSLVITQEIGDRAGEASTFNNIGSVHWLLGEYPAALEQYEQSLVVKREIGDRAGEADTLNNIGLVHQSLGEYPEALEQYEQSLVITREIGDRAGEAKTLNNIGLVHQSLGEYPEALEQYEQSLVITREIGDRAGEAKTLANIGLLLQVQGKPVLAILFLKQSINTYETIRTSIQSLDQSSQEAFADTIDHHYRTLADILLQQDRILEAQRVLDLLRVQELDNYVRGVRGNENTQSGIALRPDEQEIIKRYEAHQDELIKLGQERATLAKIAPDQRTPEQQARIEELRQLERAVLAGFQIFSEQPDIVTLVQRLRNTLGATNIELGELNALRDNLQTLQKDHNQNAVVLYPLVLEDRLELVLVTPNAPPIRRTVAVKRTELNEVIGHLRYGLEQPGRDVETHAKQLYDWLIRPIADDLKQAGADTIIYSPDLRLRYVPLAVLHDGNNWLIESYRVNNITAASLADLDNAPTRNNVSVLAAAFTEGSHDVPVGEQSVSYSGLPFAGPEVDFLATLIPSTVKRLNNEFSLDILNEMDDYKIIHLATHAAFNPGPPENSHIVFGNGDWATLADVKQWSFPNVELVVLSACETAIGDVLRTDSETDSDSITGEEILGFGYLMQAAGAEAVMGSLWKVDDGGTQILMGAFYDALSRGGLSKAAALQQAQRDLIRLADDNNRGSLVNIVANRDLNIDPKDLSHPHYWAPFILIGNGL